MLEYLASNGMWQLSMSLARQLCLVPHSWIACLGLASNGAGFMTDQFNLGVQHRALYHLVADMHMPVGDMYLATYTCHMPVGDR